MSKNFIEAIIEADIASGKFDGREWPSPAQDMREAARLRLLAEGRDYQGRPLEQGIPSTPPAVQ